VLDCAIGDGRRNLVLSAIRQTHNAQAEATGESRAQWDSDETGLGHDLQIVEEPNHCISVTLLG